MVLPPISETCFTKDFPKGTKIVVTGAGGFIGSHLARRLKAHIKDTNKGQALPRLLLQHLDPMERQALEDL